MNYQFIYFFFFFQAEDGIRDYKVTGVQTCALPILFDALDMQSDWQVPAAWPQPPGALQCLALTRVLEEALANVIKHSRAQCVQVQLQWPEPHWLMLRITDDGAGFDVAAVQQAGMGVGLRSEEHTSELQ